jgi:hypothetical protein
MVLVDYSKGHGYSVLDECPGCGKVTVLEDDIKDFEIALTWVRDFADDDFDNPGEIEEPVVSLSAVRAMLRDYANKAPFEPETVEFDELVEDKSE